MTLKANLVLDQNSDFSITIFIQNDDETAYDLTNTTVKASLRKSHYSSKGFDFSCSHDSAGGNITMFMSKELTATIEPGLYMYDVIIISDSDAVNRIVEGIVTVTPGITRFEPPINP